MLKRNILSVLCLAAVSLLGDLALRAQETEVYRELLFRSDTLTLRIEFAVGETDIDLEFNDNRANIWAFREALSAAMTDKDAFMSGVFIRTASSPEGSTSGNIRLSNARAESVRKYLCNILDLSPFIVHVTSDGENWSDLEKAVVDIPEEQAAWKDRALEIISSKPEWKIRGEQVEDSRKAALMSFDGGKAWQYLKKEVFPKLRSSYGDCMFVISVPVDRTKVVMADSVMTSVTDTVIRTVRDTVVVKEIFDPYIEGLVDRRFKSRIHDKKFLFAARTNILAVPLANVGLEFPFGRHFSIGMDIYYPWIWRNKYHRVCNELMAYDMEMRYWFGTERVPENARLLGHSIGLYGAGGHYDFERNWSGYQGTFFNIGFDWMYAFPLFHGAMQMEVELGLGFIYSEAQPYNCFEPYGDCFREPGSRKIVRWLGPTRVQVSLVVPFYIDVKKQMERQKARYEQKVMRERIVQQKKRRAGK